MNQGVKTRFQPVGLVRLTETSSVVVTGSSFVTGGRRIGCSKAVGGGGGAVYWSLEQEWLNGAFEHRVVLVSSRRARIWIARRRRGSEVAAIASQRRRAAAEERLFCKARG
ncbi:hypothetical protein RHMOL_Rhmol08G0232000 [Rhododendron molle]|uniref:Uncharacterized protein n=1 Tax=Rhododendron molle TaxID=49168 RepID=A0ACC0MS84_RHOML|nr:hypothetical protein RHMOL_Rhmol08G0232000 [Rhododendron molle]